MRKLAFAVGTLLALWGPDAASAQERLKYFGYAGYENPELYGSYGPKYGQVDFAIAGSSQEITQKIMAGFKADVVSTCVGVAYYRLAEAGKLLPVDDARLAGVMADVVPSLRNQDLLRAPDGKNYFVPREYGSVIWLYKKSAFPQEPKSVTDFVADNLKGRIAVSAYAEDVTWLAGQIAGVDVRKKERLTNDEIARVKGAFVKLIGNSRMLVTSTAEAIQALSSGEVDAVYFYDDGEPLMRKQGLDVAAQKNAREGKFTWQCGSSILADHAASLDQIYAYLNATLEQKSQYILLSKNGFHVPNVKAYELLDDAQLKDLDLSRDNLIKGLDDFTALPRSNPENHEQLVKLWEAVKSQR